MILRQIPRVPLHCPSGYGGWYTVQPGDTFTCIAQRYRINADILSRVNPHVPDTNILYVGDVLCVPFRISFPCSFTLKPIRDINTGQLPAIASGAVMVYRNSVGNLIFNIAATLPPPNIFGAMYNIYHAYIMLECENAHATGTDLISIPQRPQYMFSSLNVSDIYLSPRTRITIGLSNNQFPTPPPPGERLVLEGFLGECR